ncbi:MAG TPA: hypothetical protein VH720_15150 [Candidatus Limnocylindrales bacterium]
MAVMIAVAIVSVVTVAVSVVALVPVAIPAVAVAAIMSIPVVPIPIAVVPSGVVAIAALPIVGPLPVVVAVAMVVRMIVRPRRLGGRGGRLDHGRRWSHRVRRGTRGRPGTGFVGRPRRRARWPRRSGLVPTGRWRGSDRDLRHRRRSRGGDGL